VNAIDKKNRVVTLISPNGKEAKVKIGPEVEHLDEIKTGDSVVARLTRAVSIEVSKPAIN